MAKHRGVQFWQEHVQAWDRSELTQAAYCAAHGLSTKSFYRWRHKGNEEAVAGKGALTLVPVKVSSAAAGSMVRLHSPGGWCIETPGADVRWLGELRRRLP